MLPGMLRMRSLPLRVTDTPVPCSCARSLASCRSMYAPIPAPVSAPTPAPISARLRRSLELSPVAAPSTAPAIAPIPAPLDALFTFLSPVYASVVVHPATVNEAAMANNVPLINIDFMQFSLAGHLRGVHLNAE